MTDQPDIAAQELHLAAGAGEIAFTAAVDALDRLHGGQRPIGTTGLVEQETILFRAAPTMGFPAADITAIGRRAPTDPPSWPVEMTVAFLGLYGPSSPMPAFWTEKIVQDQEGAQNLRDFLDLFNHPLIALLHRILGHYRIHLQFDAALQGALPHAIMALAGQIGGTALARAVDWTRLLPFCGLLAHSSRSTDTIRRIVAGYFDIPAMIEEWVVRRVPIPADQLFTLGSRQAALGSGTVLGETVPDAAGAVRLVLGPMPRPLFEAFLPDGDKRPELRALLTIVMRKPIVCFVDLLMEADEAAELVLGAGQLGWTTWQAGGEGPFRCETGPI
jgi:type VI secretion system protein ImpH